MFDVVCVYCLLVFLGNYVIKILVDIGFVLCEVFE